MASESGGKTKTTTLEEEKERFNLGGSTEGLESRADHEGSTEGSVADFLRKEAKTNQDFSLSVLCTNLPGEQETELRTFIAQRLARSTMYSGNGHIVTLDTLVPDKSHMCYYCVLRGNRVEEEATNTEEVISKDFVLCLIADQDSGVDLFQKELDEYCQRLLPHFEKCLEASDVKEQFKSLDLWFDGNGLMGLKVHIKGADTQLESDVSKFVDACGSGSVGALSSSQECLKAAAAPASRANDNAPAAVVLTVQGTDFQFSNKDSEATEFCRKWAQTMLDGDCNNPVFLRQVIDNYKLRVNHDLNTLKRLLREAETDHYALYRAYEFLQKCGNGTILLQNATLEAQTLSAVDTLNILKVLEEYVAESGN